MQSFLWKNIKLVSNENEQCISVPNPLKINDTIIEGMQNIADALDDHFVTLPKRQKSHNLMQKISFHFKDFLISNCKIHLLILVLLPP